jgi:hypothetical protein
MTTGKALRKDRSITGEMTLGFYFIFFYKPFRMGFSK